MRRWRSLRDGRDFARVLSTGRRIRTEAFTMTAAPGSGGTRIGLVVRRGAGGAVTRNAIKRRLRAAADAVDGTVPADVVLMAGTRSIEVPFQKLTEDLREALAEVAA